MLRQPLSLRLTGVMMSSLLLLSSLTPWLALNERSKRSSVDSLTLRLYLFFSDSTNFRKTIQPAYKGHRNRKKPCGYKRVINQLKTEYEVIVMPTLEADDALGIYATEHPGNVICSPDKDMRQIPGQLV